MLTPLDDAQPLFCASVSPNVERRFWQWDGEPWLFSCANSPTLPSAGGSSWSRLRAGSIQPFLAASWDRGHVFTCSPSPPLLD